MKRFPNTYYTHGTDIEVKPDLVLVDEIAKHSIRRINLKL